MKPYNPIKAEEKIMSEPLTKDEQKFTDSFTLDKIDKLITHDEAKENTLYLHGKYGEAYKTLNDYITQQEQFELKAKKEHELLGLYQVYVIQYSKGNFELAYKIQWRILQLEKEIEEMK